MLNCSIITSPFLSPSFSVILPHPLSPSSPPPPLFLSSSLSSLSLPLPHSSLFTPLNVLITQLLMKRHQKLTTHGLTRLKMNRNLPKTTKNNFPKTTSNTKLYFYIFRICTTMTEFSLLEYQEHEGDFHNCLKESIKAERSTKGQPYGEPRMSKNVHTPKGTTVVGNKSH